MTFKDGSTTIGTGTLSVVGGKDIATLNVSNLPLGSDSLTAVYGATTNYTTSTSAAQSETVSQDSTKTTTSVSSSTAVYGQPVTFTAIVSAVSPGTAAPTGTVTFKAHTGGAVLGTGTLAVVNGQDVATFTTSSLILGAHLVDVVYSGDTNFTTSSGTSLSVTINPAATTTALTSSANPAAWGQSIVLTATVATVSPGSGAATGTVTFKDGTTTLGTGTLSVVGGKDIATFTTGKLAVASHPLTAVYAGSSDYTTSTSNTLTETINQAATTTTTSVSGSTSVYGQPVTFTAVVSPVSPGSGTPTGTVTFKAHTGGAVLGTGTLAVVNGQDVATFTTSSLILGSHLVDVVYGGDTNFTTSTGTSLSVTINPAATTTTLATSTATSVYSQPVTLTATVAAVSPGSGAPTGAVTFKDGSTTIGTGTLSVVGGKDIATLNVSNLPLGSDSLTAVYGATTNYTTSTSAAQSETVSQDSTKTTTSVSSSTAVYGQPVTFTAIVSAGSPGTAAPTGTVTFKAHTGGAVLGTSTLAVVNGQDVATFTTSSLILGAHLVDVVYSGDTNFTTSSGTSLSVTINPAATTTTLTTATNPAVVGQSVKLTAVVAANSPGGGTPTGPVTFMDGTTVLGTGGLSLSNGQDVAVLTTAFATAGNHSLTAVYGTTTNYTTSTSVAVSETVNQAATKTVGSANPATAVIGQPVTLSAVVSTVSPGQGSPTGTVTFKAHSNGAVIGTGTLAFVGGQDIATFTTSSLILGGHAIDVVYSGDSNFTTSTASTPISLTINPAATTTALTSSVNPATVNQSVTLTATVAVVSPGSGTPTGIVTFENGTTTIGTGTLSLVNGQYVATLVTSFTTTGTESLTAVYAGTSNFTGSTSSPLSETVNAATQNAIVALTAKPAFTNSTNATSTKSTSTTAAVSTTAADSLFGSGENDWLA